MHSFDGFETHKFPIYTSHTTNEEVLKRVNEKGLSLEKNIKMRKMQFLDI